MANLELLIKQNAEAIQSLINNAKSINEAPLFEEELNDDDLMLFYIESTDETVSVPFGLFKIQLQLATASLSYYVHTQGVPSTQWNINHGLGRFPAAVMIVDTSGNKWITHIEQVDINNCISSTNNPFAGVAYIM